MEYNHAITGNSIKSFPNWKTFYHQNILSKIQINKLIINKSINYEQKTKCLQTIKWKTYKKKQKKKSDKNLMIKVHRY